MASTSSTLEVGPRKFNKEELAEHVRNIVKLCIGFPEDTAIMLLKNYGNDEQALQATQQMWLPSESEYTPGPSFSSSQCRTDDDEMAQALQVGEVTDPVKIAMAWELMNLYKVHTKKAYVDAVKSSVNIYEAADKLWADPELIGIDDDEDELVVKKKKVEHRVSDDINVMSLPEVAQTAFEAAVDNISAARRSVRVISSRDFQTSVPGYTEFPQTPASSFSKSSPVASPIRGADGNFLPFTLRTGPCEHHVSPISSPQGGTSLENLMEEDKDEKQAESSGARNIIARGYALISAPRRSISHQTQCAITLHTSESVVLTEDDDHSDQVDDEKDVSDSDISSSEEENSTTTTSSVDDTEMNVQTLMNMFPQASENDCRNELQVAEGDVDEAAVSLMEIDFDDENRNLSQSQIMKGVFEKVIDSEAGPETVDGGGSKGATGKERTSKKRKGSEPARDTPSPTQKRLRIERRENRESSDTVLNLWLKGVDKIGTIRVISDQGVHLILWPKALLNKVPILKKDLKHISNEDADVSVRIHDVEADDFSMMMHYNETRRLKLFINQVMTESKKLLIIMKIMICAETTGCNIGVYDPDSRICFEAKKILVADWRNLRRRHIKLAYEKLLEGHPLRKLFVEAIFKVRVEFRYIPENDSHYSNDSDSEPGSDSDLDSDSELKSGSGPRPTRKPTNAAHDALFKKREPPFEKEIRGAHAIREFRYEFHDYLENSWHHREVPTKLPRRRNGGRPALDLTRETTLSDPLTGLRFPV